VEFPPILPGMTNSLVGSNTVLLSICNADDDEEKCMYGFNPMEKFDTIVSYHQNKHKCYDVTIRR